ncbi:MAG: SIS domain-containing protein [Candidatus Shapirobacteria bacterium]|jgi:glucose/mannose-6-phosphate isomerase
MWLPGLDIIRHQNYGLPVISEAKLKKRLIIFSSYSGNTEEVIDAYTKAGEMGLNRIVISVGGKLLELARREGVAYIQMPDEGIQPRSALPLSLKSMLLILRQKELLSEIIKLQYDFHPEKCEKEGKELVETLNGRVPIIYTASQSAILGYVWKITFNETGKIPAFSNGFPELDHNEIEGFGVEETTARLSSNFLFFVFVRR